MAKAGQTRNSGAHGATEASPSPGPKPAAGERASAVQHLGRYDLQRHLADGSWGPVYEAVDPVAQKKTVLRLIALDLPEHARPAMDSLFMAALRPLVALRQAHIATTFEVGVVAEGIYIAAEWLHGRSLAEVLRSGWRPSPAQAAALVRQVADGLAHAHTSAVIHGGVAPACVWLNSAGQVRLQGFALALAAQASQLPDLDPLVVGPGHYVAPEQLSGDKVTAATDVHGAGVLLYELLTGQKTYPGHTVPEVVSALLQHKPVAPHLLRPEVPKALSEIVMRAIQREPAARFETTAALSQALLGWLQQVSSPEPADLTGWGLPSKASAVVKAQPKAQTDAAKAALVDSVVTELNGLADTGLKTAPRPVLAEPAAVEVLAKGQDRVAAPRELRAEKQRKSGPERKRKTSFADGDTQASGPDTVDTSYTTEQQVPSAQWQPEVTGNTFTRVLLVAAALCGMAVLFLALR